VDYLFRTIKPLKFLDDATTLTASPSKFRLALARNIQPTILISDWMQH